MDNLTIVTGLFRSGSSLMMQVLEEGGFNPIVHFQNSDQYNENGYYEIDENLSSKVHSQICSGEFPRNSCIKVLIPFLDNKIIDLADNIIFITRNVDEVIYSTNKKFGYKPYKRKLLTMEFEAKKKISSYWTGLKSYFVDYNKIVSNPREGLNPIRKLFNCSESFEDALLVVEERLYKTKCKNILKTQKTGQNF